MLRTIMQQTDAICYYDGNPREIKRRTANYVENSSGQGSWVVKPTKYYIRSSVFGGETISEVSNTGKKLKTIVRAAGATLAWQTVYHNSSNNTDTEYVNFEQWDASAMSYRSTTSDGTTIYGEGAEGSPAELDPLGGNVGLSTPYYSEPPPVEPEYPSLQNLYGESPMYVNGQRVTATLDGMEVSVSFALNALANGSAIPASIAWAQNLPGFSFENRGLGIFTGTVFERVNLPNVNYGVGEITVNGTTSVWLSRVETFFFNTSWSPQQPRQQQTQATPQSPPQEQSQISDECNNALKAIKKNSDSVRRAKEAWDSLLKATGGDTFSASILAAMAIRESNFENVKEDGGKGGRGVFQIDITKNPNLNFDPFDIEASVRWVLSTMDVVSKDSFSSSIRRCPK